MRQNLQAHGCTWGMISSWTRLWKDKKKRRFFISWVHLEEVSETAFSTASHKNTKSSNSSGLHWGLVNISPATHLTGRLGHEHVCVLHWNGFYHCHEVATMERPPVVWGQVLHAGAQELDWNWAHWAICACVQKHSGKEMMLSGLTDDAEMVSRTKVTSVIYTQTHLTANLKLIHVSVCVCVCPSRIYLRIWAHILMARLKG